MWKLDTTKHGYEQIFTKYQFAILNIAADSKKGWTTREMHEQLDLRGLEMSRASVINYMAALAEYGIFDFTEKSGKGGYHRVYTMKMSLPQLETRIAHDLIRKMLEVFPNCEYLRYLNKEI